MTVLLSYPRDAHRDKVLRHFVARGAYNLYTETGTSTTVLNRWYGVGEGSRIIMSAVFEQERRGEEYMCPRPQCHAWNIYKEANDGWIDW